MFCRASLATSLLAAATFALSGISAVRRECPGGLRVYPVSSGFALGLYRLIPSYQLGLCPNPRPCGLQKGQNRGLRPLKPRSQGLRPRTPAGVYASLASSLVLRGLTAAALLSPSGRLMPLVAAILSVAKLLRDLCSQKRAAHCSPSCLFISLKSSWFISLPLLGHPLSHSIRSLSTRNDIIFCVVTPFFLPSFRMVSFFSLSWFIFVYLIGWGLRPSLVVSTILYNCRCQNLLRYMLLLLLHWMP